MKYIWEPCDIHVGRSVWSANRASNGESILYYRHNEDHNKGHYFGLCSKADGLLFMECESREALAKELTDAGYRPGSIHLSDIQKSGQST